MDLLPRPQRLERLQQIAREAEVGVAKEESFLSQTDSSTLSPPRQVLSFRSSDDERKADAVLGQLRIEHSQSQPQPKGLKRAFTANKRNLTYGYEEFHAALTRVIDENGLAGVAEVLLSRFKGIGGDVNLSRRSSTSVFKKIGNAQGQDQRGRLLQTASDLCRLDFVQLLCLDADRASLDESLFIALEKKNVAIIDCLLRYGANAGLYPKHFQNAARNAEIEILCLLLRAPNPVPARIITECLVLATMSGSLRAVLMLVRSGADGDHDNAAGLMYAVQTRRVDIATAIVMASNPPSALSLDRCVAAVFSAATSNLHDSHLLTEVLLCGGPVGNSVNEGLFKSTMLANMEMMQLLLEHKADINYNNASSVGHAIQRNRVDLVRILLQEQSLTPGLASQAVSRIAHTASPEDRVAVLSMLLLNGASGSQCSELLVTAVETNDIETAGLLLSFGKDENKPPVASVDYKQARSLQGAITRGNVPMVSLLALEGQPSKSSLSSVFPLLSKAEDGIYFSMARSLLQAGAQGPEVDAALCSAVTGQHRSNKLIELLVRGGASVNGQPLLMTVSRGNLHVLHILLMGNPSIMTCSAAIAVAMKLHSKPTRLHVLRLLIPHSLTAEMGHHAIAQATIDVLQNSPDDLELLRVLCQEGKADINFQNGFAVFLATGNKGSAALGYVLDSRGGPPNLASITRGLACAVELPPMDDSRCWKVEHLLRRAKPQEAMNNALIQEIKLALAVPGDLSVLQALLAAGADVNAADAAPVCLAVKDSAIMNVILAKRPTARSLSMAFPLAVTLPDPSRHNLCEKLLKAGAAGEEISKALFAAAKEGPPALPFMKLLLPQADVNYNDGRVLRLVVRRSFSEGLDLLLTQRPTMPTAATKLRAFQDAMKIKSKKDRYHIVKKLLAAGVKGEVLSESLILAVNSADPPLSEMLLQSGASVDYQGGQAVLSAASSGNGELLKLLVGGAKPNLSTLTTGYGGAMALKDRDPDAYYLILSILFGAGLRGEAVDAALVDSVKGGDSSLRLTELIFTNKASIEWNGGEAVDIATRTASLETLDILLQGPPSQNTLKRAYKSSFCLSRHQRTVVIGKILNAGKLIDRHVINTLVHATREIPADRDLVKLLLGFGVFDDGQSMIHAATVLDLDTLILLVESPNARPFVSTVFKELVTGGIPWDSDSGILVAQLMLENGVATEAVGEALVEAVKRCESSTETRAEEILGLLLRFNPDVNYQRGMVLQHAARTANVDYLEKFLPGASSDSKGMAFPYLFKSASDETCLLRMIKAFIDSSPGDEMFDVGFRHPEPHLDPVLFMALDMFPRKTQVLEVLLQAGFNPDQWKLMELDSEFGPEPLTILCWALQQPEKRVSAANISLLINSGANVNFTTKSHLTPVMLSIMNQRTDVLEKLISKGAKVASAGEADVTPLAMASQLGNATIMERLLEAGADIDDGSLHDAARELRCDALRVLIKHNHDVDFPSERHGGRSALAELCFKAVDNNPRQEDLEEAVRCLIANDADFKRQGLGGKTIFHYALDSSNPVTILKVLLKFLWKHINDDCYLYTDGRYTYSLTKYVEKGLSIGPEIQNQEVIQLLKIKLAEDRIWANSVDTPQPEDYHGAPQKIKDEIERRQLLERRNQELREHAQLQVELRRYEVVEETKLLQIKTEAEIRSEVEKARTIERITETRADQQLRLESRAEFERQRLSRIKQAGEISHLENVRQVQVTTQRDLGQARIEMNQTEQMLQIEYLEARNAQENTGVQSRLAIEQSGLEEKDRLVQRQHEREMSRLKTQKTLVESTQALANNLRTAGVNQRQIGYIMGEV